jgi:hypothetical protein
MRHPGWGGTDTVHGIRAGVVSVVSGAQPQRMTLNATVSATRLASTDRFSKTCAAPSYRGERFEHAAVHGAGDGEQHCPRGHRLTPGRALIGHQPCSCPGGHTSWACRECGAMVYAPPIGPRCRVLHGAAAVHRLKCRARVPIGQGLSPQ